jgi:hypothetical protein
MVYWVQFSEVTTISFQVPIPAFASHSFQALQALEVGRPWAMPQDNAHLSHLYVTSREIPFLFYLLP